MPQLSHELPTHNCTTISQNRCRPTKPTSVMNVPQKLAHAEEFAPGPTNWFEECRVDRTKNYFDRLPNVQRDRSAQTSAFERNKRMQVTQVVEWCWQRALDFCFGSRFYSWLPSVVCLCMGELCGLVVRTENFVAEGQRCENFRCTSSYLD